MSKGLTESFGVLSKYEAFFTGGRIQFSKDGQYILSASGEQLKLFNIGCGKIVDTLGEKDAGEEISSFLLGDDDETLIVAYKTGVMRHWSRSNKTIKRTWKYLHVGMVSCMAFDHTTTLLATGGTDSTIKVWHLIEKYCTHNLKGAQGVFSKVCFKKIGTKWFVLGSADDYKIHIWNLNSSEHVAALEGHYSTITDLVFPNEGNTLLSCGRDKVVLMWNVIDYKLLKTIPIYETVEALILAPESLSITGVDFESDCTYFITAGDKGILRVWNTRTAECVFSQKDAHIAEPENSTGSNLLISQATYIPALKSIGVVTFEHNIILYSLNNLTLERQFVGYNDSILSMKFMGTNDSHLAVATNSSQIKMFQMSDFSCQMLKGHSDIVLSLDVFSKHNHYFVSGSKDNNVIAWAMNESCTDLDHFYTGFGHTHSVTAVACCRGKSKFFVSGSEDTTLKLWHIPDKRPLVAFKLSLTPVCTVKAHDKHINALDVSANDKLVASGSQDHTAKIWDAANLSLLGTLRGHKKGVWCVNFSPVDLVLATSSGDETIRIWSLADFSALKVIEGHEALVLQVMFLSRGTQLLSSASDGNIKLWEIKNNLCIKTLSEHKEVKVWTLALSSDEQRLASGGDDSNIIVWKDVTEAEKEQSLVQREEVIVQEQMLSNLVCNKNWTKALCLALTLDKPFQAYNIIDQIILQENGEESMEKVYNDLRQDQKDILLKYTTEWMTRNRTYFHSVLILKFFFKTHDTQDILKIDNISIYIRDILPYLEMHFKRKQKRCQDMQILNFVEQQLKLNGHVEHS